MISDKNIRAALGGGEQVEAYMAYLRKLTTEKTREGGPANPWAANLTDQAAIDLWKAVERTGVYIDGDAVILKYQAGKVAPDFTYTAYKNAVQAKYPDTVFDWGLVYDGDSFEFHKDNGHVVYRHTIGNPFQRDRKIIGAYAVIRNSSGEFLETINEDDIQKFRATARTKTVWDAWYDRMVLKSIIKRICHVNFKDQVRAIEELDNRDSDPSLVGVPEDLQLLCRECDNVADLGEFYKMARGRVKDQNALVKMCAERKAELIAAEEAAAEAGRQDLAGEDDQTLL